MLPTGHVWYVTRKACIFTPSFVVHRCRYVGASNLMESYGHSMRNVRMFCTHRNTYVRKENDVALPIFGLRVSVYRLIICCTVHPSELGSRHELTVTVLMLRLCW